MSCFIVLGAASGTASEADRSSPTPSFRDVSPVWSPCECRYPKPYKPKRTLNIPENWYDEVPDTEESLVERPSPAVKALRARQFVRRLLVAHAADKGFTLGDWEDGKLRQSLLFMMDDRYEDLEGEKEYPAEWEDETIFRSFFEKTVSAWVEDLPDDEKACIERLADIFEEEYSIDADDDAGWEKHESRLYQCFVSVKPIPEEDQGLEQLKLEEWACCKCSRRYRR
ncbi:hypothetical protein FPANT_2229 [Fusarium pseudoanthophilum]|uniref:Uncharacterized protein n=1 Tax=Fusarium pseudoanthophilum TaxID=48495 RepID=A0A8H5UX34_9HYPO|nr:hypothetical protein FPANT_2229 [Fusarium pseudoanthophilum]